MSSPLQKFACRWFAGLSGAGLIVLLTFGPTHVVAAQDGSADVRQGEQKLSAEPKAFTQQQGGRAVEEIRRVPKSMPARKSAPVKKSAPIKERSKAGDTVTEPEVDERNASLPKK